MTSASFLSPAERTASARQAIVVLGMHRSGTSALAGVIAKLGAALPRTLLPPDAWNPRGYFESEVIYRIHTRLLITLDSEWDGLAPLPTGWWLTDTARHFETELADAVRSEFGDAQLFVLKDPRMCRLLPLWKHVLDRVDAVPRYVVPVRNPLEVADSLWTRDGFPTEKSLLLWLRHLLEAELETRGAVRSFVAFSVLLEEWPAIVRRIGADLAIVWPRSLEACRGEVDELLAVELRHHRVPDGTALESPTVPIWIQRAYGAAVAAARDSRDSAATTWAELGTELAAADGLLTPLLESLRRRQSALQEELQAAATRAAATAEALCRVEAEKTAAATRAAATAEALRRVEAEKTAAATRAAATAEALCRVEAEKTVACDELERRLKDAQAALARRDERLAAYEAERARFGAQIGRWLGRQRARWAPPGSVRGRLLSLAVGRIRGRLGAGPLAAGRWATPVSDRVCDWAVLTFALWTVAAHTMVASEGGLGALIIVYALALAGGLAFGIGKGLRVTPPAGLSVTGDVRAPHPMIGALQVVALAVGLALTLSLVWWPGVVRLWWSSVFLLGMVAAVVLRSDVPQIAHMPPSRFSERLLWALAVACVVLTLVAHRPDADDAFYVNVAVTAVDTPRQALLRADTLHGVGGLPLYLPVYRVHSYELWNAALAYLTGIPAIYVFHWLSAALAALLVPLAYAKLFRLLTPRWWLWSVAVVIVILVVAGETHRWYGNFAFVRMWQGKAVFLSVVLPLIYTYGLRFAVEPSMRGWILLCAAQVTAIGCTSSALWVAPVSALLALLCAIRPSHQGLRVAALGVLGSAYVLGMGWLVKADLREFGWFWLTQGGDPGAQLYEAFVTTLGDSRLLLFGIGTLLIAGAVAPPGLARRFAIMGPLALLLALLNPYVADWITTSLTGPAYWRSMWAVPLPILMTLVLTSPLRLEGSRFRAVVGRILCLAVVVGFVLLVPRYSALSATNGVQLAWPRLKVPDAPYRWAATVNRSVPPGTHVAVPPSIDPWIVTFHHHAYPLMVRHYLRWKPGLMEWEDLQLRFALREALAAPELVDRAPGKFREGLDRFEVRAVVLASSGRAGTARTILGQAGFHRTNHADGYELWIRSEVGVTSPASTTRGAPVPLRSTGGVPVIRALAGNLR